MSDVRSAVWQAIVGARDELPKRMGFAWALGHSTLYKFKGFTGDQRAHVADMLERSRLYFSVPDQFNDPFDVAPVLALGEIQMTPHFSQNSRQKSATSSRDAGLMKLRSKRFASPTGPIFHS
jgi:hypothetical protein